MKAVKNNDNTTGERKKACHFGLTKTKKKKMLCFAFDGPTGTFVTSCVFNNVLRDKKLMRVAETERVRDGGDLRGRERVESALLAGRPRVCLMDLVGCTVHGVCLMMRTQARLPPPRVTE